MKRVEKEKINKRKKKRKGPPHSCPQLRELRYASSFRYENRKDQLADILSGVHLSFLRGKIACDLFTSAQLQTSVGKIVPAACRLSYASSSTGSPQVDQHRSTQTLSKKAGSNPVILSQVLPRNVMRRAIRCESVPSLHAKVCGPKSQAICRAPSEEQNLSKDSYP